MMRDDDTNHRLYNINGYEREKWQYHTFLGSVLPLYTAMFVSQSDGRIIKKSTQPHLVPDS